MSARRGVGAEGPLQSPRVDGAAVTRWLRRGGPWDGRRVSFDAVNALLREADAPPRRRRPSPAAFSPPAAKKPRRRPRKDAQRPGRHRMYLRHAFSDALCTDRSARSALEWANRRLAERACPATCSMPRRVVHAAARCTPRKLSQTLGVHREGVHREVDSWLNLDDGSNSERE